MVRFHRRTAPRVRNGRVQVNSRWEDTPSYITHLPDRPVIDRRHPGKGYRHLLKKRDVLRFLSLLPDRRRLTTGLRAIVLAPGRPGLDGRCWQDGVIELFAWERNLWRVMPADYFQLNQDFLDRLEVPYAEEEGRYPGVSYLCMFDEPTARAFQLLAILLHELAHHHDRMSTRRQDHFGFGEDYAEQYARRYTELIWRRFQEAFPL